MRLLQNARLWATVENWEDRRFETPPRLWAVFCDPRNEFLSSVQPGGCVTFTEAFQKSTSGELLVGRYLNYAEKALLEGIKKPHERRATLFKMLVAKDAVRHSICECGGRPLYPAEVQVTLDEQGNLAVKTPTHHEFHVAVAHTGTLYAAYASGRRTAQIAVTLSDQDQALENAVQLAAGQFNLNIRGNSTAEQTPATIDRTGDRFFLNGVEVRNAKIGNALVVWVDT
jgi:hypothetical protein